MTADDLEAAWAAVHDPTPPDLEVGQPSPHDGRHQWRQYAFDKREPAKVGFWSREWTAIGATAVECLFEMARSLRELRAGRVAK